jgi:crotonobetainyl-CoA:carnitine CoA-transferase CaiB-like acyl-CoA transferase
MTNGESSGPLHGLTVVDLGRFVAGPVTATILGDFGARVIKVEKPGDGDELRELGPRIEGGSAWWALEGRNKENITLDLSQPQGQEVLKRMIVDADVVVENFRPGTLERWNLDYDELSRINPRLILIRTSGYGQSGPYRMFPATNTAGEALGGLRYIVGDPGAPPTRPGIALADYAAALTGAIGVLVALYERDRGGGSDTGQWIDNTLFESIMRIMEWTFVAYDQSGIVRERIGAGSAGTVPARAYMSRDGKWVGVAAASDVLFRRLCIAIGNSAIADDARFRTNELRVANRVELDKLIESWANANDVTDIVDALQEQGVPVNQILSVEDIFQNPHVAERESLVQTELPDGRSVTMQGVVPLLSRTPGATRWAGRSLGSDTTSVLSEWFTSDELEALTSGGII